MRSACSSKKTVAVRNGLFIEDDDVLSKLIAAYKQVESKIGDPTDSKNLMGPLNSRDGVQAAGKISIDMGQDGIDFLTLSAHKIGGPQGIGALVLGLCGITPVLLEGGGQEKKVRAGTENVAGIAGFGLLDDQSVDYDVRTRANERTSTAKNRGVA